jgi:lipopolysaccharide/colanic/teichoic acid biosynthesis glycosyltransferase
MRSLRILLVDLALVFLASFFALLLRDNLEISLDRFQTAVPYWLATLAATAVVLPLSGITRAVWRFSSMRNYVDIAAATAAIVIAALAIAFVVNRLDGIPRAMPILQALMIVAALVGARLAVRSWHARNQMRARIVAAPSHGDTIVVVGLSRLAELYLHCLAEYAPGRVHVAGVLDPDGSGGTSLISHPVLGGPEEIAEILRRLEVHGVFVDRIVVAVPFAELADEARAALLGIEAEAPITLEFLDQTLGLDHRPPPEAPLAPEPRPDPGRRGDAAALVPAGSAASSPNVLTMPAVTARGVTASAAVAAAATVAAATTAAATSATTMTVTAAQALHRAACLAASGAPMPGRRPYHVVKRLMDIAGAAVLLVILSPTLAMVAILVYLDVGAPVLFWQQRPGLRGRPFKVFKFRTMRAAHDADGRRLTDAERVSIFGLLLRRARLDELPQLFSILTGAMSFVGPRPLLPIDQPAAYSARLLVRPGLTGWAQIKSGRIISAADKAALDVWYVRNMSLALDIRIVLGTIPMVLFGERVEDAAIAKAWRELEEARP